VQSARPGADQQGDGSKSAIEVSKSAPTSIRPAEATDWPDICRLLDAAELPVADLMPQMLADFLLAESGGLTVGLVGLQIFDKIGLLRSLVVAGSARGTGVGSELLAAIETAARNAGIGELWLLTIDAEKFFLGHEFEIASRDRAPGSICSTAEFCDLCPGDAYLMRKNLL